MDSLDKFVNGGKSTYWERAAKNRWGQYISEVEQRVLLKAHHSFLQPASALEVGCEGGRWSKLLADLGWNMTCTDINQHSIAVCQKRLPQATCHLVKMDDTTLPCESKSVSLVLCIEVLNVLQSDWFMAEAFRVLQDDGQVVGVFENKLSIRGCFQQTVSSIRGTHNYYQISYSDWRRRFCNQGFEMIYEEGICWFPFSRNSNSPLIPACVALEQFLGLRRLPTVSPWIVFLAEKTG